MSNLKLDALKAGYHAEKLKALATLQVYFDNAVGIGEHPQIIDEMDVMVKKIADADGALQVIETYFQKEEKVNS